MRSLIVDVSNILFRVAAVQKSKQYDPIESEDLIGLCMHISLMSIKKWYEKYQPDKIVFAFEGGDNWRKKYTLENSNEIKIQYKANRVYDPSMAHFFELITSFKETIKSHTSVICLCIPTLEADDVIGGYCNLYANEDHQVFVLSGDKDFIQLLKNKNVKLINPDDGKFRNTPGDKNYESDLDYWLFLKCVRGDMGDYVPSAYPRVRETKIKAAYDNKNEYDLINFMKQTWTEDLDENDIKLNNAFYEYPVGYKDSNINIGDKLPIGTKKINNVGKLFEHNKILVSLFDQPQEIKDLINKEIPKQVEDISKFNHFHFISFCGKYKLNKVADEATKFTDIFSCNQLFAKNGPKQRNKNDEINLININDKKPTYYEKINKEMSKADKLKKQLTLLREQKEKQTGLLSFN